MFCHDIFYSGKLVPSEKIDKKVHFDDKKLHFNILYLCYNVITKKQRNNTQQQRKRVNDMTKREREITENMRTDLRKVLTEMFKDDEVINAHGGFAIKKKATNKRAFEISYNKRKDVYKICCHKQTAINAQLVDTADTTEQQNNFKFADLDAVTAHDIMKHIYNSKATNTDEQKKIQKRNEKKRNTMTLEF